MYCKHDKVKRVSAYKAFFSKQIKHNNKLDILIKSIKVQG